MIVLIMKNDFSSELAQGCIEQLVSSTEPGRLSSFSWTVKVKPESLTVPVMVIQLDFQTLIEQMLRS